MHEASTPPSSVRPWIELKSTGLLWLLNASVLHPRGFALGLVRNPESGEILGWKLLGDGSEPWKFEGVSDGACDQNFADIEALFAVARKAPNTAGSTLVIDGVKLHAVDPDGEVRFNVTASHREVIDPC